MWCFPLIFPKEATEVPKVHISTSYFTHEKLVWCMIDWFWLTHRLEIQDVIVQRVHAIMVLPSQKEHWLIWYLMCLIFNSLYFWSRGDLCNSIQPRASEGKSWGVTLKLQLEFKNWEDCLLWDGLPECISHFPHSLSLTHMPVYIKSFLIADKVVWTLSEWIMRTDMLKGQWYTITSQTQTHTHLSSREKPLCHSIETRVTEIMHDL